MEWHDTNAHGHSAVRPLHTHSRILIRRISVDAVRMRQVARILMRCLLLNELSHMIVYLCFPTCLVLRESGLYFQYSTSLHVYDYKRVDSHSRAKTLMNASAE